MWHHRNMAGASTSSAFGLVILCFLLGKSICSDSNTVTISSLPNSSSIPETTFLVTDKSTETNEEISRINHEMLAMQRWRNAEKLIQKTTLKALRNMLVYATEEGTTSNVTQQCLNDFTYVLRGLSTAKFWAFRMIDSSGQLPRGVLSGSMSHFGDYKSCLSVNVKNRFEGKYCSFRISPVKSDITRFGDLDMVRLLKTDDGKYDDRLLERFFALIHPLYSYFTFRMSICVPSSCTETDVTSLIDSVSNHIGLEWESSIITCSEASERLRPFDTYEIVSIIAFASSVAVAVTGTVIELYFIYFSKNDKYKSNSNRIVKIFLSFSFITNTQRLLKEDKSPESIKFFHGLKTFTVLWVILNHTYNCMRPEHMSTSINIKNMFSEMSFQLILNGYPTVDTFFFITGVILAYARMTRKSSKLNIPLYLFRRVWRLGPAVFFLTMLAFIVPRLGDGPVWKESVSFGKNPCRNNWWANLIYINNFLKNDEQCMAWVWYVAADIQLYVAALIVLVPIKKRPRLGLWILGACTCASIGAIIFNQLYYNFPPTVVMTAAHKPLLLNSVIEKAYFRSYPHAIVTCIGMATGYLIYKYPKFNVPISINIMGWITAILFGLCTVYGVYPFNSTRVATTLESVAYAAGGKIAWSLGLSWVTVICFSGNGGYINKFLSCRIFVVLSRLTYSTYLSHMVILVCIFLNIHQPIEAQHRVLAVMYVGFVVLSFMVGFVFTQLFESPYQNLEKLMFSRDSHTKTTVSQHNGTVKPEDALEGNKINHAFECDGNGAYIPDISKLKVEYKSETNSSSL